MPDRRKHRGPHPEDAELFQPANRPRLYRAVCELSWLLTRGYPRAAALKLVGDRHGLTERQRTAVMRSSCADQALLSRHGRRVPCEAWAGRPVQLDTFNVLTTIEAALSGGIILRGRDGCDRDMASMHGSYRKVEETRPALQVLGEVLAECGVTSCCWLIDRPVSNSGRLSQIVREKALENQWNWQAQLVPDPDAVLVKTSELVISADSMILDGCRLWGNLARRVIETRVPNANILDLEAPCEE